MAEKLNKTIATAAASMLSACWPELTGANLETVIERGLQRTEARPSALDMPYLTRLQAAKVLKVSVMTIQRMLADGRLHSVKIGQHSVRIPAASVENLLAGMGAAK